MVSAITERLNHHVIGNGNVEVNSSEFTFESDSESDPYTETTPIKAINDDKMDHLLELLH